MLYSHVNICFSWEHIVKNILWNYLLGGGRFNGLTSHPESMLTDKTA